MTLEPGIHEGIAAELYHADPCDEPSLSASVAKILLSRSPLHAWHAHPRLNPRYEAEHSDKFDLGTAAHLLFLQGDKFAEQVSTIDATDWRTSAAKAHKEAVRAAGLTPLLLKDWQRVVEMVGAIRDQLAARDDDPPLFDAGKPEQTLIWREHGVLCKARLDWLADDLAVIDDLKTTSTSAERYEWERRAFWPNKFHIQARLYQRAVKAITGQEPRFRFFVVESHEPFAGCVPPIAESTIALADAEIDKALAIWRDCLQNDRWPGYDDGQPIEVTWQEASFLQRHWAADQEEAA